MKMNCGTPDLEDIQLTFICFPYDLLRMQRQQHTAKTSTGWQTWRPIKDVCVVTETGKERAQDLGQCPVLSQFLKAKPCLWLSLGLTPPAVSGPVLQSSAKFGCWGDSHSPTEAEGQRALLVMQSRLSLLVSSPPKEMQKERQAT